MKRINFLYLCFIFMSTQLAAGEIQLTETIEEMIPAISDIRDKVRLENQSLENLQHAPAIPHAEDVYDEPGPEPDGITVRDPFNSSQKLGLHSYSGQGHGRMGTTFLPDAAQTNLPDIRLKGIITLGNSNKGDLLALLEVNKKDIYMVRAGDEVSYDPGKPASAIKIKTISRLSVTVEVGSLGNTLVIR